MFQKFMNKKFFHPGSLKNMQKIWETEQKEEARLKLEAELASKYQHEQEVINNKLMYINNDERLKQGLSFMYDVPLSVVSKDDGQNADKKLQNQNETEVEKPVSTNEENDETKKNPEDQFNVEIDNLKSCDPLHLARGLYAERGLIFSKKVVSSYFDPVPIRSDGTRNENETFLIGDDTFESESVAGSFLDEVASEMDYIKTLTYEEKKRLLEKLEKMDDGQDQDNEKSPSPQNRRSNKPKQRHSSHHRSHPIQHDNKTSYSHKREDTDDRSLKRHKRHDSRDQSPKRHKPRDSDERSLKRHTDRGFDDRSKKRHKHHHQGREKRSKDY